MDTSDTQRNHFVPRFYLRGFGTEVGNIHVFRFRDGRAVLNVSVREQGAKRGLHKLYPGLEEAFTQLEDRVAPVIREVIATGRPPQRGSEARAWLIAFVAAQEARTPRAAAVTEAGFQKAERVVDRSARRRGQTFKLPEGPPPLAVALSTLSVVAGGLADLRIGVIRARDGVRFVTSDHPPFKYNAYCEGIHGYGTLGAIQNGHQVFMPLSPTTLLLLYDGNVYKVGKRGTGIASADSSDVEQLNAMQVIGCDRILFFSEAGDVERIAELVRRFGPLRKFTGIRVQEFPSERDRSSLLAHHEQVPNLRLSLSFASITKRARAVPLWDRAQGKRQSAWFPDREYAMPPGLTSETKFGPAVPDDWPEGVEP